MQKKFYPTTISGLDTPVAGLADCGPVVPVQLVGGSGQHSGFYTLPRGAYIVIPQQPPDLIRYHRTTPLW